jgi:hypothetical protein
MVTTNADGNTRTERIDLLVETSTDWRIYCIHGYGKFRSS